MNSNLPNPRNYWAEMILFIFGIAFFWGGSRLFVWANMNHNPLILCFCAAPFVVLGVALVLHIVLIGGQDER